MRKRFLLLGILAVLFFMIAVLIYFAASYFPGPSLRADPSAPVEINAEDGRIKIINHADGYLLSVPEDATIDTSRMESCLTIYEPLRTTSVFREDLSAREIYTYINYSKSFLNNTIDHTMISHHTEFWHEGLAEITQWKRPLLSRVENDKPYYTCIDLAFPNRVFTFLIKSAQPISESGGYQDLLEGFSEFVPSANAECTRLTASFREKDPATEALYQEYFSASSKQSFGIYFHNAPAKMENLLEMETAISYDFPILMTYNNIDLSYNDACTGQWLKTADDHSRPLMLTLQTTATADGGNMVYDVLDGQYDEFLAQYAQAIADFGKPMLLRIGNEMNGDWCTYCAFHYSMDAELYRLFYEYIISFFDKAGTDNVLFVWNPNERAFPNYKWNHMSMYYPDCGADIFGVTGYNTGTYYPGETWRSFEEIYTPIYTDAVARTDIPLMITEFSCSDCGGDKEAWLRDMFEKLPQYDQIKVAIWWNSTDYDAAGNIARQYRVDLDRRYLDVFQSNLGA